MVIAFQTKPTMSETIIAEYQSLAPFYTSDHPKGYYPKNFCEDDGIPMQYGLVNADLQMICLVATLQEAVVLSKHMGKPVGEIRIVRVKEIFKN